MQSTCVGFSTTPLSQLVSIRSVLITLGSTIASFRRISRSNPTSGNQASSHLNNHLNLCPQYAQQHPWSTNPSSYHRSENHCSFLDSDSWDSSISKRTSFFKSKREHICKQFDFAWQLCSCAVFVCCKASLSICVLTFNRGLWAFDGWDQVNYVAAELANTSRDLPRVIHISVRGLTLRRDSLLARVSPRTDSERPASLHHHQPFLLHRSTPRAGGTFKYSRSRLWQSYLRSSWWTFARSGCCFVLLWLAQWYVPTLLFKQLY